LQQVLLTRIQPLQNSLENNSKTMQNTLRSRTKKTVSWKASPPLTARSVPALLRGDPPVLPFFLVQHFAPDVSFAVQDIKTSMLDR
jgi:hypothetical protein